MGSIDPAILIATLMVASTPVLLAALGELVVEKAGVLNLGVEGMMIIGAVCGFIGAYQSGSALVGFATGAICGAALAMIFGILTQVFLSNQVPTGLALTLFGLGLSAMIGQSYAGLRPPPVSPLYLPGLRDIPVLGPMLFRHDLMLYLSLALVFGVWWFLNRSRAGLVLRAVGENHDSAHSIGYPVVKIRLAAIAFGGAMAGLGGAYLSLARVPQWTEGMTKGEGWIALAIVVFASWRPGRLLLGAYLFGGIAILQVNLQAAGFKIPAGFLAMSPYLMTILVLVAISLKPGRGNAAPAALGKSFHATT